MSPAALKASIAGVLAAVLLTACGVWQVQDWHYGKELAEQARLHQDDLTALRNAAAAQVPGGSGLQIHQKGFESLYIFNRAHQSSGALARRRSFFCLGVKSDCRIGVIWIGATVTGDTIY